MAQLPSDDQHLTQWLLLVGLCSGALYITYILLWKPFQPYTQQPQVQQESYESFVHVTDGILLPSRYQFWSLQSSTFSVLEKLPSSGKIT
jgi:hypothetical protein